MLSPFDPIMDAKDQQTLILAVYKENCDQARHHEVQRERVTTIVAQTTGFILGLCGFATAWSTPKYIHLAIPAFIVLLGFWGFVAAWKHNERSKLHVQRVRQCRKRLSVLSGIDLDKINSDAKVKHLAEFGPQAELETRTHIVWKAFHLIVAILGIVILIYLWPRVTP
jgi:4-amino-4-deoxy-L-arabinose transferase-like glycosyltransferase